MSLAASIFSQLSTDTAIVAALGQAVGDSIRIYPGRAAPEAVAPYVVFQTISAPPDVTHGEASASGRHLIQFSCVASTYLAALTLGNLITAALDSVTLAAGEVCLSCSPSEGFSEATDQFLRIVEADFFVPNAA